MRYWRIALGWVNGWERQNYTPGIGGVCLKVYRVLKKLEFSKKKKR
jgi:hypothetical protein